MRTRALVEAKRTRQNATARSAATRQTVFVDNRPEAAAQRSVVEMANSSPQVVQRKARVDEIDNSPRVMAQRKRQDAYAPDQQRAPSAHTTGLPDRLKSGVEALSGLSMDAVQVHYNSPRPADLSARAYTQGTDIHVAPGQEEHLPHEAWHVAQQAQGRVTPTLSLKASIPVNDDRGLEHEADVMGAKALQMRSDPSETAEEIEPLQRKSASVVQRFYAECEDDDPKRYGTFTDTVSSDVVSYKWIDDPRDPKQYVPSERHTGWWMRNLYRKASAPVEKVPTKIAEKPVSTPPARTEVEPPIKPPVKVELKPSESPKVVVEPEPIKAPPVKVEEKPIESAPSKVEAVVESAPGHGSPGKVEIEPSAVPQVVKPKPRNIPKSKGKAPVKKKPPTATPAVQEHPLLVKAKGYPQADTLEKKLNSADAALREKAVEDRDEHVGKDFKKIDNRTAARDAIDALWAQFGKFADVVAEIEEAKKNLADLLNTDEDVDVTPFFDESNAYDKLFPDAKTKEAKLEEFITDFQGDVELKIDAFLDQQESAQALAALRGDWASVSQAKGHFVKHKGDTGYATEVAYLTAAKTLTDSAASADILTKVRADGDTCFFRISTGEFAIKSKAGKIRTLFRPGGGKTYYNNQN